MADSQSIPSDFERQCMERAAGLARFRFRHRSDRDELVSDAESVAWEHARRTDESRAPVGLVAQFAVYHVAAGRQFRQSVRSVMHPAKRDRKPHRSGFDVADVGSDRANPATIAGFRIDFGAFLDELTERERGIVELLAVGEQARDVARRFGVSPGRITQIRQELRDRYYEES